MILDESYPFWTRPQENPELRAGVLPQPFPPGSPPSPYADSRRCFVAGRVDVPNRGLRRGWITKPSRVWNPLFLVGASGRPSSGLTRLIPGLKLVIGAGAGSPQTLGMISRQTAISRSPCRLGRGAQRSSSSATVIAAGGSSDSLIAVESLVRSGVPPEGSSVEQFVTVEPQVLCQARLVVGRTS